MNLYTFGPDGTNGSASMKDVLGGKGANLCDMSSLGVPVPPGFIIPCVASVEYMAGSDEGKNFVLQDVYETLQDGMDYLTDQCGYPFLVSVRSGARVSMPGMMDTILNVGITSKTLTDLIGKLGHRAALDSYRRLIQMYSSVALGVPMEEFEQALSIAKKAAGVAHDSELSVDFLEALVEEYFTIVKKNGKVFPDDAMEQLRGAVVAVFKSWMNPRAIEYRKINNIPDNWGTAVTVQRMVFGNLGEDCCTGVLFSRDPANGHKSAVGEFLINAQGEDVVAGIRTPEPLTKLWPWNNSAADALAEWTHTLETHYRDMQDIEFTVEQGTLYILQTRNGKRSPLASFKIAYDLAMDGTITRKEAYSRVSAEQLIYVMRDRIDPAFKDEPSITGIAAGGGVVTGEAVFSSKVAETYGKPCILVTKETDPDDIGGMNASVGILTATGGLTSHAAVVARGMNKSCVVGATGLSVMGSTGYFGGQSFGQGTPLTLDGATGRVWVNKNVPLIPGGASDEVRVVCSWGLPEKNRSVYADIAEGMTPERILSAIESVPDEHVAIDFRLLGEANDAALIQAIGEALEKKDPASVLVVVDTAAMAQDRKVFRSMFGGGSVAPSPEIGALLNWPPSVIFKTTVTGAMSENQLKILKHEGFKTSTRVQTFADLLEANGPVSVDECVVVEVFGGTSAYHKALDLVEKSKGTEFMVAPTPAHWYGPIMTGEK